MNWEALAAFDAANEFDKVRFMGEYLAMRIDELGESIPPFDELFPYMRARDIPTQAEGPLGGGGLA